MERDGYREKEKERQRGRERETERARDAVPLLPPVSQLGSVQLVLEKEAIICKPSSSVHTWTCFQHLSPRAVSVTNSNKHPKLITLLPLNSFCKEQKKSSPTEQLWDLFPLFFFFSLSSVPSFVFNCYEAHVCSYAELSKVWVRFTSLLVTVL